MKSWSPKSTLGANNARKIQGIAVSNLQKSGGVGRENILRPAAHLQYIKYKECISLSIVQCTWYICLVCC